MNRTQNLKPTEFEGCTSRQHKKYLWASEQLFSEHHNLGKRAKAAVLRIERWARAFCLDTVSG